MAGGHVDPALLHGIDLTRHVTRKTTRASNERLYWRTTAPVRESGNVREGDFKLMITNGKLSLYNLKDDISEANDVSASHSKLVQRMYAGWKD